MLNHDPERNTPLSYETRGRRENPAIVFLHGFMGSAADWSSVSDRLSESNFCVMVDLPGHGKTSRMPDTGSYTLEGAGRAVIETIDCLGIKGCTLLGYSMGGRTAIALAMNYPQYFRRVILESSTAGIPDPAERKLRRESDERLARKLESVALEEFLADWYKMPLFSTLREQPEVLAEVIKRRGRNSPDELAKSLRSMGTGAQDSYWDRLSELQTDLVLITGEKDQKFRNIAQKMVEKSGRISHYEVPGAGHNIHLEAPERYTEILKEIMAANKNSDQSK